MKKHDKRQILVKSFCLRVDEEPEKAPKEGKIRKNKNKQITTVKCQTSYRWKIF